MTEGDKKTRKTKHAVRHTGSDRKSWSVGNEFTHSSQ